MSFTAAGYYTNRASRERRHVTVTWWPATERHDRPLAPLTGDSELVTELEEMASRRRRVQGVPLTAPVVVSLGDGGSVLLALATLLEPGFELTGEPPPLPTYPPLPPEAVA